jgi:hypothetical protein
MAGRQVRLRLPTGKAESSDSTESCARPPKLKGETSLAIVTPIHGSSGKERLSAEDVSVFQPSLE